MLTEDVDLRTEEVSVAPGDAHLEELVEQRLNEVFPHRCIRKVLFVVPPEGDETMFDYATARRGRYWNHPPYGPAVIASHLRQEGADVRILNLHHEILKQCQISDSPADFDFMDTWNSALSEALEQFEPDLVGLTSMFTQTHRSTVQVSEAIKRLAPNVPLVLGGVHITNCFMSREVFGEIIDDLAMVDFFFFYEAELALTYFVRAVNRKAPATGIYQTYSNTGPIKIHFTGKNVPSESDLDVVPAHDLIDLEELSQCGAIGSFFSLKRDRVCVATVLSNRGCRGHCTYCSVRNFNGKGVRHKSIDVLIDEMRSLRERGIEHFMWLDDDLFFNQGRAVNLFNEMVRKNIGLTWDCTNGVVAASCTEELIAAAAQSGCIGLNVGIESGNPEVLKSVRKPSRLDNYRKAAEVFRKFEQINTRGFLMIGFPNETYGMILDTYKLALEMDLDWYNITILQPLPNTPIFDLMVQQGLVDATDAKDIRFNSGPFGKRRENVIKELFSSTRTDPFASIELSEVPPKSVHESIWLYMNFNLNFRRLLSLERQEKLQQQQKYLRYITEAIAPDDPFPMYFHGYLLHKLQGAAGDDLIGRLESCLASSAYWSDLFAKFGLSPDHLRAGRFPAPSSSS